jgi:prephenate dehydrogenase
LAVQLTIIGLGQIGTSIGLALANQPGLVTRIGHDHNVQHARQAEKLGAVEKIELNLPNSVRRADMIVLSLPIDQIQETMRLIAQDLRPGVVVVDTAPLKEIVVAWAKQHLPQNCHYIGLTPVINPLYLHEAGSGVGAARADLFQKGLMAVVTPSQADSDAIKLVVDLTRLMGATPFFVDPLEIDSLMAATHILPQLMAAALLNSTVDQPGWMDGRKLAGRAYAQATGPSVHLGSSETINASVQFDRENVLRVLDSTIAALQEIREDIQGQDQVSLADRLEHASDGRQRWWQERQVGDWAEGILPSKPGEDKRGFLGRLVGPRLPPKPKPPS